MYTALGDGVLKHCIEHPNMQNKKLFLLFDATHNVKNAYNNWINKGKFTFPQGSDMLTCKSASFVHIKQLYETEEASVLKVAHRLTASSLHPNNIQRTSPQLSLGKSHTIVTLKIDLLRKYSCRECRP